MPPGRGVPHARFPVDCLFTLFCRAGDFARRTLLFLKIIYVRRGLRPQARFGLAPQRRFGAQPPKAALSAQIKTPPYKPG